MWLVTLTLVAAVVRLPDPALTIPSRVRPTDPAARALVADGIARSPTMAALVADLNRRDLVIYVETGPDDARTGSLQILSRADATTYVHVRVNPDRPFDARIAALAHELTHALEIARSRPVATDTELAAMYRRVGYTCGKAAETGEAVLVERRVLADLVRQRPAR